MHDDAYELMLQMLQINLALPVHENADDYTRVNPASVEELLNVPSHTVLKRTDLTAVNKSPCSICLEEYTCRQHMVTLRCEHAFHKKCIRRWLTRYNKTCPVCRTGLTA